MHGMRLLPSDMWISKLLRGFNVCRNLNKARRLNKRSDHTGSRHMRPWPMPLVTSIDLGQTHKEKIKSLSFNKSIGISLLIHNMTKDL